MEAGNRKDEGDGDVQEGASQPEPDAGEDRQPQPRRSYRRDHRAVIYPQTFDEDGRAIDNLGRVQPSRLNWLRLIRAVPSLVVGEGRAFRRHVPDDFFTLDVEEDGTEVAVVSCPCGETPRVPLARCVECTCQRFYLATGSRVLVANSPVTEPPTRVVD